MGDIELTKGSKIFTGLISQTNPKYFENPDKFDPDRWENEK